MARLTSQLEAIDHSMPFGIVRSVQSISGLTIEASDLTAATRIAMPNQQVLEDAASTAEVIGFQNDRTLLMPLSHTVGAARGDRIENITSAPRIGCSERLLGQGVEWFWSSR